MQFSYAGHVFQLQYNIYLKIIVKTNFIFN